MWGGVDEWGLLYGGILRRPAELSVVYSGLVGQVSEDCCCVVRAMVGCWGVSFQLRRCVLLVVSWAAIRTCAGKDTKERSLVTSYV